MNEALRRQLRRDALSDLLAEMRQVNGPVPQDRMEEVRRLWPASGDEAATKTA